MATNSDKFKNMEKRFIEVANLDANVGDLGKFPLSSENPLQVKTDKEKSNKFGEVFTPLWLVDEMIGRVSDYDWKHQHKTTLDMCAGYGQFTIRMMRKKFSVLGAKFKLGRFLKTTHSFNELQLSSCYKLMYIFNVNINLFIGDSRKLPELDENENGVVYYSETHCKWINITQEVLNLFPRGHFTNERCDMFVEQVETLITKFDEVYTELAFIEKCTK